MLRTYMDSSGCLVRKPHDGCPLVMNHVIILAIKSNEKNKEHLLIPIAEMVTSSHASLNIEMLLIQVNAAVKRLTGSFSNISDYLVVDWSFAEFNAIAKSNGLTLREYLKKMFEVYKKADMSIASGMTLIASCSSHLSKNVSKDVRIYYPGESNKLSRGLLTELVLELMNCESFELMDEHMKNLLVVVCKSVEDNEFQESYNSFSKLFDQTSTGNIEVHEEDGEEYQNHEDEYQVEDHKQLFKSSGFYQEYSAFADGIESTGEGEKNLLYNKKFAEMILKKYIAFLPFFAGPFMQIKHFKSRANNGAVERYFGLEKKKNKSKHNGVLKPMKVGRFVRQREKDDRVTLKKLNIKLQSHGLCSKRTTTEDLQDNWKNRNNTTYFSQMNLKKSLGSK